MDVLDAFYHTVHDYPGGAESLAPRMGMSPSVLNNKADRKKDSNKPLLADSDKLMALTGDYRVLHALARLHGHVCIAVNTAVPTSDLAVLELVTQVWRTNGDVGRAVDDVLADGRVDRHELESVSEAIYRQVQSLNAMRGRLEGMAQ